MSVVKIVRHRSDRQFIAIHTLIGIYHDVRGFQTANGSSLDISLQSRHTCCSLVGWLNIYKDQKHPKHLDTA